MPPTLTPAVLKPAAVDRCDGDRILVEALVPKLLERVDIGVRGQPQPNDLRSCVNDATFRVNRIRTSSRTQDIRYTIGR